ncbi:MerR family transcriptional regulator [Sedimentisphaera salicampi]|uniref:helix-turn-helix domain-containing protein n=1 Tax=Sedimentisphaera salicampi TaxID=1941349 RepID=UPI000B9A280D|nr:helix-turn-helix domain-containing protein [Sedimentisphaera salicampi]OXU13930.1 hypothetical protein SMSP1_02342 [Sedimentisphaera salicampi]
MKLKNINQIANELDLPLSWIKEQVEAGKIPCLRIGRKYKFELEAVKASLAQAAAEVRQKRFRLITPDRYDFNLCFAGAELQQRQQRIKRRRIEDVL